MKMSKRITATDQRIFDLVDIILDGHFDYGSVESCDRRHGGKIAVELARYGKADHRRHIRRRFADEVLVAVEIAEDELFPERSMCANCLRDSFDVKAKQLAARGLGRCLPHLRKSLGFAPIAIEPLFKSGGETSLHSTSIDVGQAVTGGQNSTGEMNMSKNTNKGRTLTQREGMLSRVSELVEMQVEGLSTSEAIEILVDALSNVIARAEDEDIDKLVAKTKRQLSKSVKRSAEIWAEIEREWEEEERAQEQQRQLAQRKVPDVDGSADADVDEPRRLH
jgi:hypothetical protein